MRRKMLVAAAGAACGVGGAAVGQPTPSVGIHPAWRAWPSNQNLLMFGDAAEIWVDLSVTPAIGTVVSFTTPQGPGTGTLAGLGIVQFDIQACDSRGGTWTLSGSGFHGTTGTNWGNRTGWGLGLVGNPQPSGDVIGCVAGQFTAGTPNPLNPVNEAWRGQWMYSIFDSGRWVRFTVVPVSATVYVRTMVNGQPVYQQVPAAAPAPAPLELFMDTGPPPPCWVNVTGPPASRSAYAGSATAFTVAYQQFGVGCQPPTFRWRKDCQLLADNGRITGSQTQTLRIDPVQFGDEGRYDVLVGAFHSYSAALTVLCYPNCDGSTEAPTLNILDFNCFINRYAAGDSWANCDGSTSPPALNILDFNCFLNRFTAGCP